MKVCVLFEGDIYHPRGEFMAIHNRVKYLVKEPGLSVDVYVIQRYYDNFTNWIRGNKQIELKDDFPFDGIHYHCLYYKRSYLDYFIRSVSHRQTTIEAQRVSRFGKMFVDYDLCYAHSLYTGCLAMKLKRLHGIPFVMMWHGSNIHTAPFENKTIFSLTKRVLLSSNHNFFVSEELLKTAKCIGGPDFKGSVSPNGIDTRVYYRYSDEKKRTIAEKHHVDINKKNIAYIGNYLPIKNVHYLPALFQSIHASCPDTCFHIIGNGNFGNDFANSDLPVVYWGNQAPERMPDIYNCMQLVVLPSKNEGLPMTCLEALSCGASFVGSRVGGIADVVGINNTVPLSDTFEADFARLCIDKLTQPNAERISLSDKYNIEKIVAAEAELMKSIRTR